MWRRVVYKLTSHGVLPFWHRQMRGMTLGTRSLVMQGRSEVLLVRHTYVPGWMLPGGGVERGETIAEAAIREVREEAGVVSEEEPRLLGLCSNHANFPGDHIAVMLIERFHQEVFTSDGEIAEAGFFNVSHLPDGTTVGTRRRITEFLAGRPPDSLW